MASFGDLLRKHRASSKLTRTRSILADKLGVSVSYLYLLETNKRKKPRRGVIDDIARVMPLTFEEKNELLVAAGYEPVQVRPETIDEIYSILANSQLDKPTTELLVRELNEHAERWKRSRAQELDMAVLPMAGWESRLLAPERLETMIFPAAVEAIKAGITQLIIVIAPTKPLPLFEKIRETNLKLLIVTQEAPLGLGHAILETRRFIGEKPFAVILPVDVDPDKEALKDMKAAYLGIKKPMLAVNPGKVVAGGEFRHYGLAILGSPVEGIDHLHFVDGMEEKRTVEDENPNARMIIGRWILTPDLFDFLQTTPINLQTEKLELTDALERYRESGYKVCAYALQEANALLPLASVRALIETFVKSINDRETLTEMIKVARDALYKVEAKLGEGGESETRRGNRGNDSGRNDAFALSRDGAADR